MSSSGGSRSSDEEEARNTGGRVVRAPIHFTKKDPGADKVITATATTTAAEDGRPPSPELQGSAEKAESAPSPPRKVFRNLFRLKGPKQNQVVAGLNQDPCEKFSECQAAPPSYQEARIEAAWREIGIDVDDPKHGPRPHCTPEQLMQSMDAFFGKVSCHASGDCNSSKDVNKEKKKEKKEKNKVGGRDPLGPTKVPEQQKIKRTLSEDSGFAEKRGQTESLCLTGNLKDSGWA
ncbi:hypothetical protein IE53DRAFT_260691 [Violaceomyces palustris]|uniref:Uncharacterized protein n=1 Tax=Violaceomyces palustris TaxID=1673888 RepID=A0ACD0P3W3_9BASI|nr:hypothetical protein IE53DRAFT_260691 [Violaceomyces palustris]